MKFYTVENLDQQSIIPSSGIDLTAMSKVFKILDKKSEMKELDQVIDFNLVFLEGKYQFEPSKGVIFAHQDKKINFAVVKANTVFEVKNDNTIYYCAVHEGKLKSNPDKKIITKLVKEQTLTSQDPIEGKAIDWLNNGRVGLSSGTMCASLFPHLRSHHKLSSMHDWEGNFEINIPHDPDDFGRCLKFLEAVPEAKGRLDELKSLNKKWKKLVENWSSIESLMVESKNKEAYDLIQKCTNDIQKMKI